LYDKFYSAQVRKVMRNKQVSKDDLLDVQEMTRRLEEAMSLILQDNDMDLAVSALMSSTINCIFGQCSTIQEIEHYRNVFIKIMNSAADSIKPV